MNLKLDNPKSNSGQLGQDAGQSASNAGTNAKDKASRAESAKQTVPNKSLYLSALLVFLLSLVTALIFHLTAEGPKRTLCFDARQYFFDTGRISEFLLAAVHGQWRPQLLTDSLFLTSILADGPAFPSLFGFLLSFTGHVPGIQDCRLIEVIQSVMHAISASLIFGLSYGLTKRIKPSICAGLFWGTYPAAIFWSGIFYTETTVILFTMLFVAALALSRRLLVAVVAGLLAGMVALLKPALLPAAGMASLLSYRFSRKSLIILLIGTALALAPWMLYTKVMTGQARITANRFPAFNLAMGADTEVDGCLVSPAPPLTTMFSFEDKVPIAFPLAQWEYRTGDCLRMAAVKLSALWSRQANDFRQTYFGIQPSVQNFWHLFLLWSGISGIFLLLTSWRKSAFSRPQQTIIISSLIFLATHFCYVLFTPAARYGMTAMPFFLVFAAYAYSVALADKKHILKPALCSIFSAVLVFALCKGTSLSPIFDSPEKSYPLIAGTGSAEKHIDLKNINGLDPKSIYSVLLLVDGDNAIESANVRVNEHELPALRHIRSYESELYQQSFELRSLGYPAGISTDEFRHWRAVAVPAEFINWNGDNKVEIVQLDKNLSSHVYAEPKNDRRMLAINHYSVNSLCNSDSSLDLRVPSPIRTGNSSGESSINHQSIPENLRIKFAVALGSPFQSTAVQSTDGASTGDGEASTNTNASIARESSIRAICSKELASKSFDLYVQDPTVDGIRVNRINMKAARSTGTTVNLPELPKTGWLRVRVEGDVKSSAGTRSRNSKAEVVVALQPAKQMPTLVLNMAPQQIAYDGMWHHFVIEDVLPAKLLAEGKAHSIYIAAYPGPWLDYCGYVADKRCADAQFRKFRFQISQEDGPDLAGKRLLFY